MPIFEFECPKGHITETIVLSKYLANHILCPFIEIEKAEGAIRCGLPTEKIWSIPASIQIAPASKVFINPRTGESQIATSQHEKAPKGFIEKILKGPVERSKFEKEDNAIQNALNEFDQMRMDDRRQHHQKLRHEDLKAKMNSKQTEVYEHEDGRVEKVEHYLDNNTKRMLTQAMQHSNKKRVPKKITERRFAVNHTDSSNLQDAPQNKRTGTKV